MTRDHIQVILLLGYLVEKGYCRVKLGAHLNISVELEGELRELRGYPMERAPVGIRVVPMLSPDGRTVSADAQERLSASVRELVLSGRQFCTPWTGCPNPPVVLWADCGKI